MTRYRIICTLQEPCTKPPEQAHIVKVGTGSDAGYAKLWTIHEVVQAKKNGDTFYTQGKNSGKIASVEAYYCPQCNRMILRSTPDAVTDNNLDNLASCRS